MNAPDSAPRRLRRLPFFRVETLLFLLVPTALLASLFFRPLIENERFAYRDVGYFYYPLFEQIQSEWERGRLPLWDPFENLGQPLAGNPTSSVFYPGKAIFFLSSAGCVDFNACFSLYIIGHVAFSFFGVFFLSRRLKISRSGAVLAGLSYSFSGPILFQYSNVVFLVGAAWLPFLALFSFDFFASATFAGKLKSALKLSVAQALAILGGEPQIVYLSTLAFFAFALFAPVRLAVKTALPSPTSRPVPTSQTSQTPQTPQTSPKTQTLSPSPTSPFSQTASSLFAVRRVRDRFRTRLALGLLLVGVASTATFFLAAPQILPSAELIARSERAANGAPRSLWEVPTALWRNSAKNNAAQIDAAPKKAQNNKTAQNKKDASTKEATQNAQNGEPSFAASLLGGEIENNGRNRATYRFSVGPWRWAERLFPNVGGRQFPRSSRWFAIFPEEISVWTPTLYCGVVPYLFALAAARFRVGGGRRSRRRPRRRPNRFFQRKIAKIVGAPSVDSPNAVVAIAKLPPFSRRDRSTLDVFRVWATWLVVVSTAAALGGFGVVWAVRFATALLSGAAPASAFVDGDPVGGLYWLFNLTLPKFVEFRYPAKLLTLSALGLAVLTGIGWDERRFSRRFFILGGGVGTLALAAFLALSACGDGVFSTLRAVDPLHGPVQPRLAFESARGAFGQTALVLAATLLLLAFERNVFQTRFDRRDKKTAFSSFFARPGVLCNGVAFAVLAIAALDLYAANAWTIATTPRSFFESRSEILRIVETERAARLASQLADAPTFSPPKKIPNIPNALNGNDAQTNSSSRFNAVSPSNSPRPAQLNAVSPLNTPRPAQLNADAGVFDRLDAPPLRVYRFPIWFPVAFPTRSSSARIAERVVWDAATLFPKYPFSRGIATIDARGTAMEANYAAFIDAFPLGFNRDADAAFLDVAFFLGPPEVTARLAAPNDATASSNSTVPNNLDAANRQIAQTNPNAPDAANNQTVQTNSNAPDAANNQTVQTNSNNPDAANNPNDPLNAPLANNANPTSSGEFSTVNVDLRRVRTPSSRVWIFRDGRPAPLPDERAEVVVYEPNRIVYFVELTAPADLVFAEQYWPDWEGRAFPLDADADVATLQNARFDADAASAFLKTRRDAAFDAPLEPTLRFLRQTSLPAGTYCLVATYRPRRLFVGAILGAVAWSGVLVVGAANVLRRRRLKRVRGVAATNDERR